MQHSIARCALSFFDKAWQYHPNKLHRNDSVVNHDPEELLHSFEERIRAWCTRQRIKGNGGVDCRQAFQEGNLANCGTRTNNGKVALLRQDLSNRECNFAVALELSLWGVLDCTRKCGAIWTTTPATYRLGSLPLEVTGHPNPADDRTNICTLDDPGYNEEKVILPVALFSRYPALSAARSILSLNRKLSAGAVDRSPAYGAQAPGRAPAHHQGAEVLAHDHMPA